MESCLPLNGLIEQQIKTAAFIQFMTSATVLKHFAEGNKIMCSLLLPLSRQTCCASMLNHPLLNSDVTAIRIIGNVINVGESSCLATVMLSVAIRSLLKRRNV